MSTIQRDHALRSLAFAHAITEKAIAGFPESKLTHQPSPTDNHLLWTIGHLTTTYAWFKSCFDGAMFPLPDSYNDLFGMGSKPKSDHAAYPGIVELKRHFESSYEAFIAAAKSSATPISPSLPQPKPAASATTSSTPSNAPPGTKAGTAASSAAFANT